MEVSLSFLLLNNSWLLEEVVVASVLPAPDSPAFAKYFSQMIKTKSKFSPEITMQVSLPFLRMDLYAASAIANMWGGRSKISLPEIYFLKVSLNFINYVFELYSGLLISIALLSTKQQPTKWADHLTLQSNDDENSSTAIPR